LSSTLFLVQFAVTSFLSPVLSIIFALPNAVIKVDLDLSKLLSILTSLISVSSIGLKFLSLLIYAFAQPPKATEIALNNDVLPLPLIPTIKLKLSLNLNVWLLNNLKFSTVELNYNCTFSKM